MDFRYLILNYLLSLVEAIKYKIFEVLSFLNFFILLLFLVF
jgi:hypothetical protein